MTYRNQWDLDSRIHLIDGMDLGMPGRTGTYVIQEEQLTLVETGPSPSIPYLLQGLKNLGYDPADVKYIIVTHIHLDHAGGAGLLLQECLNATVVVHPKGARHLADPSRLIAGAKAVYSDKFDSLFDPIVPIPNERLMIKEDGDTLTIGANCTLQFLDTPGHAAHHFSIYDPVSQGIFTGDTAGIRYHDAGGPEAGVHLYLPTTSPNQFDPEAMQHSIERFRKTNPQRIYFGHFGMTTETEEALNQVSSWIPRFVEAGEQAFVHQEGTEGIVNRLLSQVSSHLKQRNVPDDHPVYQIIKLDLEVCAMGLWDYFNKRAKSER
jgi:glyoxylase-like metal-dependent hydrolase (beta-lactamase superfamily II)